MSQKSITIEKRKFDWLIHDCNREMKDADEYFEKIDFILSKIQRRGQLYYLESWDSNKNINFYSKLFVKQVNYYKHTVLAYKKNNINKVQECNIMFIYTQEELDKLTSKVEIL
jgi:hypothetical protein